MTLVKRKKKDSVKGSLALSNGTLSMRQRGLRGAQGASKRLRRGFEGV